MKKYIIKCIQNNYILNLLNKVRMYVKRVKAEHLYGNLGRRETFTYIYKYGKWGRGGGRFFSGDGSYIGTYVDSYCETIKSFIKEKNIKSVCDLGCGDFHVASKWITEDIKYEGVDIVIDLINSHKQCFGNENIHFHCLDIVEDELPNAELCIIRQVLQHLNNEEIMKILAKIKKYKYVIVTEHVTQKEYASQYNIEKEHGSHTRVLNQSGVYIDEDPFNFKVEVLLKVPYDTTTRQHEEMDTLLIVNTEV